MTNEELIKGLSNISCVDCVNWNRDWGVCDADRECMDYINEAIELVGNSDKLEQKSKKPRWNHWYDVWECECRGYVDSEFGFCPYCGSKLDWSEEYES